MLNTIKLHPGFEKKSFRFLRQIAALPHLAKHVKVVEYETNYFLNGHREAGINLDFDDDRRVPMKEIQGGCEVAEIFKTNEDRNTIMQTFTKFPNLKEVLTGRPQIAAPNWTGQVLQTNSNMSLKELSDLIVDNELDNALSFGTTFGLPVDNLLPAIMLGNRQFTTESRQFIALLEATFAAGIKLQTLRGDVDLEYFDDECVGWPYGWLLQEEYESLPSIMHDIWIKPYNRNMQSVFDNLRDIHLTLRSEWGSVEKQHDIVGQALRSAKKLTSLSLTFEIFNYAWNLWPGVAVDLEVIVGKSNLNKIIWPDLISLNLSGVKATQDGWTGFLNAYSPKLRELRLGDLVS